MSNVLAPHRDRLADILISVESVQQGMVETHPLIAYTEAYRRLDKVREELTKAIVEVRRIPI